VGNTIFKRIRAGIINTKLFLKVGNLDEIMDLISAEFKLRILKFRLILDVKQRNRGRSPSAGI
jgi:hypothetical protein